METDVSMRLDKLLANAGCGSRSEVKTFVRKGRISVNGIIVKEADMNVSETDTICFDGKSIDTDKYHYFMLNKPEGIVSATEDIHDETVIDLFKGEKLKGLYPVGRLDKDTHGLLIITDDGELGHFLLSPSRHVDKSYYARVKGEINTEHIEKFREGLVFKDFTAEEAKLEVLSYDRESEVSETIVTIHEGKFHQIKRMFHAVGGEVIYLKRISFGPLKLDDTLREGEYRALTKQETELLKSAVKK